MQGGSIFAIPMNYMQGGITFAIPIGYIVQGGSKFAMPRGYIQGGSTFAIPIGYIEGGCTFAICILTYNELDHSLPACVPVSKLSSNTINTGRLKKR
jgi:hypothetical protein